MIEKGTKIIVSDYSYYVESTSIVQYTLAKIKRWKYSKKTAKYNCAEILSSSLELTDMQFKIQIVHNHMGGQ